MAHKSMREELQEIWWYWCSRARAGTYASKPWYLRALAYLLRRCK